MNEQMPQIPNNYDNLIRMFDHASRTLKYPKVLLHIPSTNVTAQGEEITYPLRIQRAGSGSRQPGTLNLTDNGPYGANVWYGRIHRDGQLEISRNIPAHYATEYWQAMIRYITNTLDQFNLDPGSFAGLQGKKFSNCCFCQKELTNPGSIYWGYGPICADNYGLPWSDTVPDEWPDAAKDDALAEEIANGLAPITQSEQPKQPEETQAMSSGFSFNLKPATEKTPPVENTAPAAFQFPETKPAPSILPQQIQESPEEQFRVKVLRVLEPSENGSATELQEKLLDMVNQVWESPTELVDAVTETIYDALCEELAKEEE